MKNYILFSTNDSRAIDNVSFVIETNMDRVDATKVIAKSCKYSNFTVSTVGAPLSCTVFDMEHALEVIKSIKLHRIEKRVVGIDTFIPVIPQSLKDNILVRNDEYGCVLIQLKTEYKSHDAELCDREIFLMNELRSIFSGHLAYNRARNEFILRRDKRNYLQIDYGLVGNTIVQTKKMFDDFKVEI